MHRKGIAVGSLCSPLCISKDISSLTCHSFKATKEAVFSAEWHNVKVVFKSVSPKVDSLHWHNHGVLTYPTEKQFLSSINAVVRDKFNISLPKDVVMRLSRLTPPQKEEDPMMREKEMNHLWTLIQDNEYLMSVIYTERDVFPQLLGTCGPYFAVEYVEPIEEIPSILGLEDSREDWAKKLRVALLILDLLDELETGFKEPLYLCDVKLEHFGLAKGGARMKYLDLNNVYPKSIIIQNIGPTCTKNEDCELYDCKSYCNKNTNTCANSISNSNMQIVCEKVFLGWRMSGRVLVPGLLMSPHTPSELASILRQCANPDFDTSKSKAASVEEIKKRLYNTLVEMEQSITNDFFL